MRIRSEPLHTQAVTLHHGFLCELHTRAVLATAHMQGSHLVPTLCSVIMCIDIFVSVLW